MLFLHKIHSGVPVHIWRFPDLSFSFKHRNQWFFEIYIDFLFHSVFYFFDSHCSNHTMLYNILTLFSHFSWNIWPLRAPWVLTLPVQPPGATGPCPSIAGAPALSTAALELDSNSAQPCPGPCWAGLTCGTVSQPWETGSAQRLGCPAVPWLPCSWLGMGWTLAPRPTQGSMCCCCPLPCSLGESVLYCSTVIINMPPSFFLCKIRF